MTATKYSVAFLALFFACSFAQAAEPIPADAPPRWWKGNLHTHTLWSDGNDFPEMVAEWYRERGYHFLALSEHNIFAQGQKWVPVVGSKRPEMKLMYERYFARFGPNWIETRGTGESGLPLEVRLKPFSEFRTLVEEPGSFLMIPGEEISDRFTYADETGKERNRPIHLNATNIVEVIQPQGGTTISEMIDNNLKAVHEQQARTGQAMLPHLNHPNFQYAVTAEDVAHAVSDQFFEIFNGHPGINYPGDELHASMEKLWDIANTIRLAKLNAPPLYGLGTDDSHHYNTEGQRRSIPGRGWIMVRSRYLTPESLIRAIKKGDFYASSGVSLDDVRYDAENKTIEIDIQPEDGATYKTAFIGTPIKHDLSSTPVLGKDGKPVHATGRYKDEIGKTFATIEGQKPRYKLTGEELYVRAVITSTKPHPRPTFDGQTEQAWTQPVGWSVK
ncbi:MAG TPA: hypothetical protein VGR35_04815 [Tepidisphaeraceae bacterium]|nr:hypothetical protein [Tepidisphaeraceae bacterium]